MRYNERFIGLDSLRVVMVFFVIALHCGMTYMDYRPDWWYVLDSQKEIGFTYLVVILDYFPMTVLFFLSGYFASPSLRKRGAGSFIKDKFLHIGIPWILGVILVAPFFSRATFVSLGYPSMPILDYFKNHFFSSLYQQAHYWFLGVLFLFFIVYALVASKKEETTAPKISSPLLSIVFVFALTAISYYLSTKYYKSVSEWTNLGYVLYFQPARFVGYAAIFALGIYANKQKWFTKDGWKPSLSYLIVGMIGCVWLIYWKFNIVSALSIELNLIIDAITYSLISICMTFGLVSVFLRERSADSSYSLSKMAPYSYGVYWLHQIIAMLTMYYLVSFDSSALIKWILAVVLTIVISTLMTKYILKKVPLLRKIF